MDIDLYLIIIIGDKYQDTNIATQQEENEISSIEWSHSGSSLNRGYVNILWNLNVE